MAKYLKKFNTHNEYEEYASGGSMIKPNVSYCNDDKDIHFNKFETRIIAKLNVTSTENPTSILTAFPLFKSIEIDGILQPHVVSSYVFDTLGEHTVKYTLVNDTTIGNAAFVGCYNLTSVTIGDNITTIDTDAFHGCSGLTSIEIPNNVTSIGNQVFQDCYGLTSVTISDNITTIGIGVFANCSGLTSVTIPNNVTAIGNGAFAGCSGLTSLTIPNNVTTIEYGAFSGCTSILTATIGSGVTSIGSWSLYGWSNLTSLTFNASCGVPSTFGGSHNLKEVIIGDSVTSIDTSAFGGCNSLTSITIGNGVTSIGNSAFNSCESLTSITIPSGVTSIGDGTFGGCRSLQIITSLATTEPHITPRVFENIRANGTLYVPSGSDYSTWMGSGAFYLGLYNWTKVEQ
jgi:hypothetical protein